jgi:SAM-dependent methyltransferase
MDQMDSPAVREFWERHSAFWSSRINYDHDPDGLGQICHAGMPLWFNEYYAYFQRYVFRHLLQKVSVGPAARALDVGCGAGRWCRVFAEAGYKVVGIDVQPELIELDRHRFPAITFECLSIEAYQPEALFDVVSSVTVLQHIPYTEQTAAIKKLRGVLKIGGFAIILENVRDQGFHMFAKSAERWCAEFAAAGFECLSVRRYDYSPILRSYELMKSVARKVGVLPTSTVADHLGFQEDGNRMKSRRSIDLAIKRIILIPDRMLEQCLVHSNLPLSTVHCGFLLKAI